LIVSTVHSVDYNAVAGKRFIRLAVVASQICDSSKIRT